MLASHVSSVRDSPATEIGAADESKAEVASASNGAQCRMANVGRAEM